MTREQLIEMCAAARASLPAILAADARDAILRAMSSALIENKESILAANAIDIENAKANGK